MQDPKYFSICHQLPKARSEQFAYYAFIKVFSRTGLRLDTFQSISSPQAKKRKLRVV